jgi:hypothetical protein
MAHTSPTATSVATLQPTTVPQKTNAAQSIRVPLPPPSFPTPPPQPSVTPCPLPTVTPTPAPSITATATPSANPTSTPTTSPATCTPCGQYSGNNPSQATIQAALDAAAAKYGLPPRLVYAVAWQESNWHEDIESCDGGVGLMQVQYYTYPWLNQLNQAGCDVPITPTSYNDPYNSVQDNAYLGAKYLAWLKCLYAYNSPGGGTSFAPADGSTENDYYTAGNPDLAYPDTSTLNGQNLGPCAPTPSTTSPTPSTATPAPSPTPVYGTCSLCLSLYNDNSNGPTATLYQDMADSNGVNGDWSCPFDPTKGITDYELLDLVLSAYNAGPGAISQCGCIPNLNYVGNAEYWVTLFAEGHLPS